MPVVINEFEVVAEPAPAPRPKGGETEEGSATTPALEPSAVSTALRALEVQALRVWAH
jgi:hypothetical protein